MIYWRKLGFGIKDYKDYLRFILVNVIRLYSLEYRLVSLGLYSLERYRGFKE